MNWYQFTFPLSGEEERNMLIAVLDQFGFEGFEETTGDLLAFIRKENFREEEFSALMDSLPYLTTDSYYRKEITEQNWNELWEQSFQPVYIEDKIYVRASFHEPDPEVKYELVVDPKMAFGTGHHETTYLMMELMLREEFHNKTVLDFGCGTGILAILAAKMGASEIAAVDNDEHAIENALENISLNKTENIIVSADAASLIDGHSFDFILANVTRQVIIEYMQHFSKSLAHGGLLLVSGFLSSDKDAVEQAAKKFSLHPKNSKEMNGWVAMVFRN